MLGTKRSRWGQSRCNQLSTKGRWGRQRGSDDSSLAAAEAAPWGPVCSRPGWGLCVGTGHSRDSSSQVVAPTPHVGWSERDRSGTHRLGCHIRLDKRPRHWGETLKQVASDSALLGQEL